MRLTFTSAAGSVTFGPDGSYRLLAVTGTGGPSADVQLQRAPYQDGGTYIDALLEPRELEVEAAVLASTPEELDGQKALLARVFNPKLGPGTLLLELEGFSREIEAVSEQAPVFPTGSQNQARTFQRVLLRLLCPDPCWRDPEEHVEEMAAWLGGLEFPLEVPTLFAEAGQERVFTNAGDVPAPVLIEFNGPALNPKVENLTTGEFVRVVRELASGEKLIIDTAFGQKRVTLVTAAGEQNALHWIDLNSTFWRLVPGENRVKYSADAGADQARLYLRWKDRHTGV